MGLQVTQRVQAVDGAAPPARQLGHKDHVDFARLRQRHEAPALGPVVPGAGSGLTEDADDLGLTRMADACAVAT